MPALSSPDLIASQYSFPVKQAAVDCLVPGNQSADPVKEQHPSTRTQAFIGVYYKTAWLEKQKLMRVISERKSERALAERVEVDNVYLGIESIVVWSLKDSTINTPTVFLSEQQAYQRGWQTV